MKNTNKTSLCSFSSYVIHLLSKLATKMIDGIHRDTDNSKFVRICNFTPQFSKITWHYVSFCLQIEKTLIEQLWIGNISNYASPDTIGCHNPEWNDVKTPTSSEWIVE